MLIDYINANIVMLIDYLADKTIGYWNFYTWFYYKRLFIVFYYKRLLL